MGDIQSLSWWIIGLPLVGFLIQSLLGGFLIAKLGRKAGTKIAGSIANSVIVVSFLLALIVTSTLTGMDPVSRNIRVEGWEWIAINGFRVPFELRIDTLSMTMVLIITGIGALIHLYSTGYMAEEKDYPRFFSYLNLFIAAMLILVMANNLVLMFVGWEGVGLCSYLLIGFWYDDLNNTKAANKAFIVNRIGDWGLTIGLFMIVAVVSSSTEKNSFGDGRYLSYDLLLPTLESMLRTQPAYATAIALLLFVGACGKSAQFPLYLWLPDAMAGPTPVSALIHAATMVTSGVVLLNRMHVVFEASPVASAIICAIGAFTALFAAIVAFGQTDIKKVLAYSTVSQLGFMFVACGSGAYWAGMFHVTTHAFFKALLFLGSGAVIHAMAHDQDMRNYGNLRKYLPITFICMSIGWIAISGLAIPGVFGFAGYYSKEAIIGSALANSHASIEGINVGLISGWVCLFVALLTAFYMTRMTFLTFMGAEERWRKIEPTHAEAHGDDHDDHHALDKNHTPKEVPISMWFPLVVLAGLSIVGGWYLAKGEFFYKWLYPADLPVLGKIAEHPHNVPLEMLSLVAALGGIVLGIVVYAKGLPEREGWDLSKWSQFQKSAGNQFGFDAAMVTATGEGGAELARGLSTQIDTGLVQGSGVGIGQLSTLLGNVLRSAQTGFVRMYAIVMLGGLLLFTTWIVFITTRGGR